MRVQDVMTTDVRTIGPEVTLKEAAAILSELRISGLPVVEEGKVAGVVSEADILVKERGTNPCLPGIAGYFFDETAETARKLAAVTARDAMSAPAITIAPARPVSEAAGLMIDRNVNRLPVVDDDGALLGIVTRADLVRAFVRSDEAIAREIREDVILKTLWIAPEALDVTVDRGAVRIGGYVESKSDAELIVAFARRVPGTVSVDSNLSWIEENGHKRR